MQAENRISWEKCTGTHTIKFEDVMDYFKKDYINNNGINKKVKETKNILLEHIGVKDKRTPVNINTFIKTLKFGDEPLKKCCCAICLKCSGINKKGKPLFKNLIMHTD